MATKKVNKPIEAQIKSPVVPSNRGRQFRDRVTRVMSPIKGQVTNAKQWNRWTP